MEDCKSVGINVTFISNILPMLRYIVDLCSLGGASSPRVQGLEGKAPEGSLVGLEPKYGVLHQIMF